MKRLSILGLIALLATLLAPTAMAQGFRLGEPSGAVLIRNINTDLAGFTWTALPTATSYDVSVFKISTIPRDTALGGVFTQNVTLANCSPEACSYTPSPSQRLLIDRGRYAWTVVANTSSGSVEAGNAPLFFSYEPATIALVANSGFESGTLDPWIGAGLTQDVVKAGVGKDGSRGFEFKASATENSKIKQPVANVPYYGIGVGDTLTLSVDYMAPQANVNGRVIVKLTYATPGVPQGKFVIPATQQLAFFTSATNIFPAADVAKIQVIVSNKSTKGKFTVDNVTLTLAGTP